MKTFVRDSTVRVKVNFYDECGVPVNPLSATITFNYTKNCTMQNQSYPMTQSGTDWIYIWDSRVSDPGPVFGHAQTDGDVPVSSVDFKFLLKANRANIALTGPLGDPPWDDYEGDRAGGRF